MLSKLPSPQDCEGARLAFTCPASSASCPVCAVKAKPVASAALHGPAPRVRQRVGPQGPGSRLPAACDAGSGLGARRLLARRGRPCRRCPSSGAPRLCVLARPHTSCRNGVVVLAAGVAAWSAGLVASRFARVPAQRGEGERGGGSAAQQLEGSVRARLPVQR